MVEGSERSPLLRERRGAVLGKLFDGHGHGHGHGHGAGAGHAHRLPPSMVADRRRSWLADVLSSSSASPAAETYRRLVSALIAINALGFVASTVHELAVAYDGPLKFVEGVTSVIFLMEYVCRLWVVTEKSKFRDPLWGRIRYAFTYRAVIDALATFPFFIELLSGVSLPLLTWVRIFRLFRLLRSEKHAKAFNSVYRVFYYNQQILSVALAICLGLAFSTSIMLFYFGPPVADDSDGTFASLPATMYLSLLMLSGQGGPEGPLPWYTKIVVLITSVFSVAVFSIPAGMLVWAFEAEAERLVRKQHEKRKGNASTSSESWGGTSSGLPSSWEDYENVILGGSSSGGEADDPAHTEARFQARVTECFNRMDVDQSGQLSLPEVLEILRQVRTTQRPPIAASSDTEFLTGQITNLTAKVDRLEVMLDTLVNRP